MSEKIIDFNNVSVVRSGIKILDSISISVKAGENTAILGPNGSGKSTLIKLMTREVYPMRIDDMVFKIFGNETWDVNTLRGKLGIVSDSISLFSNPDVSCFDVVASSFYNAMNMYNTQVTPDVAEKSIAALEFMEVSRIKDRLISEVSSGEARRVFIARALAHKPKALLLDEPTNSLDISAMKKFRETISRIAAGRVTVIISTHTMEDLIPGVKNIIMLKEGRVFISGRIEKVLNEKNLTGLFGTKIKLVREKGHYTAF